MSRWFTQSVTTLAFCWRLDRRDGITLGLTSHDHDLWFAGLCYRAAPGLIPSALEQGAQLQAALMELAGVLTSDLLRAEDLTLGRWDGARLHLWAVDWTAPDTDPLLVTRGELGQVTVSDGRFSVDLKGAAARLDREACETTSPQCRARLGDARCRVDMAGRTLLTRVTGSAAAMLRVDRVLVPGAYAFGRLRWTEGQRAGLSAEILANDAGSVTLVDAPDVIDTSGLIELTEGCDRRFATCVDRFANGPNFRGEPHLPGNDLLVRYGG